MGRDAREHATVKAVCHAIQPLGAACVLLEKLGPNVTWVSDNLDGVGVVIPHGLGLQGQHYNDSCGGAGALVWCSTA